MPRVVYNTATTLNGFIATADHSLDWLFAVPGAAEAESAFPAFLETIGAIVMGSSTYEWILRHEEMLDHPERWVYGSRAAWVFSSREQPLIPGAPIRIVSGPVAGAWAAIAESAGEKDVWVVGGGDLAGQFADAGHLDEVRLSLAPVALDGGMPVLPRTLLADRLSLVSAERQGQFAELRFAVRA